MRKIFRGLMAIKSLAVGLAILLLWGRSYFVGDVFRKGTATQYVQISSASGSAVITFGHDGQPTHLAGSWGYGSVINPADILRGADLGDSPWNHLGFGFTRHWVYTPTYGLIV